MGLTPMQNESCLTDGVILHLLSLQVHRTS